MLKPLISPMIDEHGRRMRKLRLSLLDACNFRCFYCMPQRPQFMQPKELLSVPQIVSICQALVDLGIEQIRVTGGEPTLRPEFQEIMRSLSKLPLDKLGLTTNGLKLLPHLELLRDVGCTHLNISLDSLDPDNFYRITRSRGWSQVVGVIRKAKAMEFNVKVNVVVARGKNDHEIIDFVRFSENEGVEVRFLELMRIGPVVSGHENWLFKADEMLAAIRGVMDLSIEEVELDSTAFVFSTPQGGRIGFIASESKPFCGSCSRLRLSADGKLRACLMSEAGVDLRNVQVSDLPGVLQALLKLKPTGRLRSIDQGMYQIGG